uniref:histone acetyltransferase n=1 Tax=Globisporangium ultimum (strain ATCC 200006 / CBS 805.95 / DAOM BR144) TaxID=431595 RepID=K3WUL4_GLOUD
MTDGANQAPSPSASSMETSEVTTTVTTTTANTTTPTTSEASMATEVTSTEMKTAESESASVAATKNLPLAVAAPATTAQEEKSGEVRDDAEVTRVAFEKAQSLEPPGSTSEQDQVSAAAAPREEVPPQEATNDVLPPVAATATEHKEEEGKETNQESQMQASVKETTATEEKQQEPTPATQASAGDKRKIETSVDTAVPKENAHEKEATPKKQKIEEVKAAGNNAGNNAAQGEVIAPAPVMLSRDDMAKMEEDDGLVKFDVITNDGTPEHMVQLTTLKNIFAKQLPKMPKEYIVRLVFDRNHHSMVILKNGTHVIGGICYRPFLPNHFAEIAFCAINAADQVKGYGTRLMNHLKEYVKKIGITHFLTYADNYAIGYFKKQGFAKVVSMPKPNWFGYIKDYDGGTLMECTIHYQIDYLRITSMVHKQRKAIQDKIKERSRAHITYPGLTKFAEGRLMDIYMIPGVKEAGWSQATIRNSRIGTRDPGSLKTQLMQIWKAVSSHRSAWPFHEPVDTTIVVDYLDYIKDPVDLSLIAKRIESGQYISKAALRADLDRMCENCTVYNTPDTNYYKAAKDLQEFISRRVQIRDSSAK